MSSKKTKNRQNITAKDIKLCTMNSIVAVWTGRKDICAENMALNAL